jgi:hypothetical protein
VRLTLRLRIVHKVVGTTTQTGITETEIEIEIGIGIEIETEILEIETGIGTGIEISIETWALTEGQCLVDAHRNCESLTAVESLLSSLTRPLVGMKSVLPVDQLSLVGVGGPDRPQSFQTA